MAKVSVLISRPKKSPDNNTGHNPNPLTLTQTLALILTPT